MKSITYERWLEERTIPEPNSGCLIWLRGLNGGYGFIRGSVYGESYAHRYVWSQERGPIPDDMCVLHRCDNPTCCNIDHLFLGTKLDNAVDRDTKGRLGDRRGQSNGRAKLTDEQAREIRDATGSQREIGLRYGVNQQMVSRIKAGEAWSHV